MGRGESRIVAAVETDAAHMALALRALERLCDLQVRLCFQPVGAADVEEIGSIIGDVRRGLEAARRWIGWVRNGRTVYDDDELLASTSTTAVGPLCDFA